MDGNKIIDSIKDMSLKIIHENPNIPSEASFAIKNIHSHAFLINFVSSNMNLSTEEKQRVLSILDLQESAIECLKKLGVYIHLSKRFCQIDCWVINGFLF